MYNMQTPETEIWNANYTTCYGVAVATDIALVVHGSDARWQADVLDRWMELQRQDSGAKTALVAREIHSMYFVVVEASWRLQATSDACCRPRHSFARLWYLISSTIGAYGMNRAIVRA